MPEIVEIPLDQILEPEMPTRTYMNSEKFTALVDSISEVGVLEPIHVKQNGDKFEIITGHRRYLASKECAKLSIPCIVETWDERKAIISRMHSDLCREDINPVDLAEILVITQNHLKLTQVDLAKRLGRSTTWVIEHMKVADYPGGLKDYMKQEVMGFSVAKELAKITDPDTLQMYADMAVTGKITGDTAREWVRNWQSEQIKKEHRYSPEAIEETAAQIIEPKGKCSGCLKMRPLDTMIRIPVCPECYNYTVPILRSQVKWFTETSQKEANTIEKKDTTPETLSTGEEK